MYYDPYLAHYGVKGMKWGVRRAERNREKARMHRRFADDYDPSQSTVKLSNRQRARMTRNRNKELAKAQKYEDRANYQSMSRKERKANRDKRNSRYSDLERGMDKASYGSRGVKRINRRMNKGQSHARATLAEDTRGMAIGLGASAAVIAGLGLYSMGPTGRRAVLNAVNNAAKMKAVDLINDAKARNAAKRAQDLIPKLVADNSMNNVIKLKPWQYKVR